MVDWNWKKERIKYYFLLYWSTIKRFKDVAKLFTTIHDHAKLFITSFSFSDG